jgi:hypothetical protein
MVGKALGESKARLGMNFLGKVLLLALVVTCGALSADVAVLYGGNRQGAYEPCGCPVKQLGGLPRWARALEKYRGPSSILVDAGNALLPPMGKTSAHRRLVGTLVADVYRSQKIDAIAPGPSELAEGLAFLESLELPWVSANVRRPDGSQPFPSHRIVRVAGETVAVVGLSAAATGPDVHVYDAAAAWRDALADVAKAGATRVVVLSSLGLSATAEVVGTPRLPTVIVGSTTLEAPDAPRRFGPRLVGVETEPEGKHLGIVHFSGEGQLVELDASWKNVASVDKRIAEFRQRQQSLARTETSAMEATSKAGYVANAYRCQQCHREQYDFWKGTHHASAYLVLFAKGAHLDPECVVCHSLAFEQRGGFDHVSLAMEGKGASKSQVPLVEQLLERTFAKEKKPLKALDSREDPKRYAALKKRYHDELDRWQRRGRLERVWAGIQCEHCHGSRVGHPENGAPPFGKVPETTCRQCHKDPHHPGFDFASLRAKVACPPLRR